MNNKKIFSFDAETNGLWGKSFSIAAVVLNENETNSFIARCPIEGDVDEFVKKNVLPEMLSIPVTHNSYEELLTAFIKFYLLNKADADIIIHMGLPVEARLFIDAHNMGILGDWDAPYPLIDISAFPEVNTSVDKYNQEHNIIVPDFDGGTHNPLYDSMAAALCYQNIINKKEQKTKRNKLFCDHNFVFFDHAIGDIANNAGGKRQIYKCTKCNKIIYR